MLRIPPNASSTSAGSMASSYGTSISRQFSASAQHLLPESLSEHPAYEIQAMRVGTHKRAGGRLQSKDCLALEKQHVILGREYLRYLRSRYRRYVSRNCGS